MKQTSIVIVLGLLFVFFQVSAQKTNPLFEMLNQQKGRMSFKSYSDNEGQIFAAGDSIVLLVPSNKNKTFASVCKRMFISGVEMECKTVDAGSSNKVLEIESVFSAPTTYTAILVLKDKNEPTAMSFIYQVDIANALKLGEAKLAELSSEKVEARLKDAKDNVEKGVLTQKEYDELAARLNKRVKAK